VVVHLPATTFDYFRSSEVFRHRSMDLLCREFELWLGCTNRVCAGREGFTGHRSGRRNPVLWIPGFSRSAEVGDFFSSLLPSFSGAEAAGKPHGAVLVGAFGQLGQLLAVALLFVIPVTPVVHLFLDRDNQSQPAGFEQ